MDMPSSILAIRSRPGVGATNGCQAAAAARSAEPHQDSGAADLYGDAQPLLAALTGPVAPKDWRGALAITYHVGPGPPKFI